MTEKRDAKGWGEEVRMEAVTRNWFEISYHRHTTSHNEIRWITLKCYARTEKLWLLSEIMNIQ